METMECVCFFVTLVHICSILFLLMLLICHPRTSPSNCGTLLGHYWGNMTYMMIWAVIKTRGFLCTLPDPVGSPDPPGPEDVGALITGLSNEQVRSRVFVQTCCHLWIKHSYGTSSILMVQSSINGQCSIAMLNCRRVSSSLKNKGESALMLG